MPRFLTAALTACLFLSAAAAAKESAPPPAAASNGYAFAQYAVLSKKSGNLLFSPYSVHTAFAMVFEGARGGTADEMRKAFAFPARTKDLRKTFSEGLKELDLARGPAVFTAANSLWAQAGYKFKKAYLGALRENYRCEAFNADFAADPEAGRARINTWVEEKTASKIKSLFPENSLNSLTRLVLANAVYFKGAWKNKFPAERTEEGDFYPAPGKPVKTMFMHPAEPLSLGYTETPSAKAVDLPYAGGTLVMTVILPDEGKLAQAEGLLSEERLPELYASMDERKVALALPRFKMGVGYNLQEALDPLGVRTAFTDSADLSGMDGTRRLMIQKALHKCFIEVNEEGTEAAAATGVSIGLKSIMLDEPAVFRADRPFLFLIRDRRSGLILFMGRFSEPEAGN